MQLRLSIHIVADDSVDTLADAYDEVLSHLVLAFGEERKVILQTTSISHDGNLLGHSSSRQGVCKRTSVRSHGDTHLGAESKR